MFVSLKQRQSGNLLSNTIQNQKIDNHCLAISTQSVKATIDPPMPVIDDVRNDTLDVDNANKTKIEKLVSNNKSS